MGGDFKNWVATLFPLSDTTRSVGIFHRRSGRVFLVCWLRKLLFHSRIVVDSSCLGFLYWELERGLYELHG